MAVTLNAEARTDLTGSHTRLIRSKGSIPAIVYGHGKEPTTISVDSMELVKTLREEGKNAIISLNVGGSPVQVMLHEYQSDPLKDELIHADFYVVDMSEAVDVEVAIHLDGEAQGVKDGGILQQPLHELAVRAKPGQIPDEIKLNVSSLTVGDSITVGDLKGDASYEILDDENTTIVTILAPQTEAVTESGEQQAEMPDDAGEETSEE